VSVSVLACVVEWSGAKLCGVIPGAPRSKEGVGVILRRLSSIGQNGAW
jgi:hypothetical protein